MKNCEVLCLLLHDTQHQLKIFWINHWPFCLEIHKNPSHPLPFVIYHTYEEEGRDLLRCYLEKAIVTFAFHCLFFFFTLNIKQKFPKTSIQKGEKKESLNKLLWLKKNYSTLWVNLTCNICSNTSSVYTCSSVSI